jgi:antitoxin component YwqK of YwqJK toxin-antitoxin module
MKYFFVFIFLLACLNAESQAIKIFFDKNDQILKDKDSLKAATYILKEKLADTGWYVKEYQSWYILSEGMYRDEKMKIPQGKFTYYSVGAKREASTTILYSFIERVGYYSNGLKTGTWIKYDSQGGKNEISNYTDGKKSGLYQQYTYPGYIFVDGSYKNDKREGEWHVYNKKGTVISTDTYLGGRVVNSVRLNPDSVDAGGKEIYVTGVNASKDKSGIVVISGDAYDSGEKGDIQNAAPDRDFKIALTRKVMKAMSGTEDGQLLIGFMIDRNGNISSLSILKGFGNELDRMVYNAIPDICKWNPAVRNNKAIIQSVYCRVKIHNSQVAVDYFFNMADANKD